MFPARAPEQSDRFRQCVLLAGEPAHEPPTADFTTSLETPVDAQDVSPRCEQRLALDKAAKYHAIPPEQLPGDRLGDLILGNRRLAVRARPAAGGFDAEWRDSAATPIATAERATPIRRHEERPHAGEAVGRDEPPRDQLGQSLLDLGAEQASRVHEIAKEQRAARIECGEQRFAG